MSGSPGEGGEEIRKHPRKSGRVINADLRWGIKL